MYDFIQDDIKELVGMMGEDAKKLEGSTILITGGAGFLGKYFVATIIYLNKNVFSKPAKMIILDNFITGDDTLIKGDENIVFVKHDISKKYDCEEDVDYVIHAAGIASPIYYKKHPMRTMDATIFGLRNVLDFAKEKNAKSVLFFSSSEVYGDPDAAHIPTSESYQGNVSFTGPRACYDESKRIGETICGIYYMRDGLPIKSTRPFNIYGPGMRVDDYRVIANFVTKALRNEPLTVHDKGGHTRTFCYITDGIAGFWKVLLSGRDGQAYNIGNSNEEISILDLARRVKKAVSGDAKIEMVDSPEVYAKNDPKRRCPDLSQSREHLGFEPKVSLDEGLARTVKWYKHIMGI